MLVLEKISVPGWEFKTKYIDNVLWMLDQSVCQVCKMTEAEYKEFCPDENPEELRPETYNQWSTLEKIEWLLGTACGCEFDFYDESE
jgi:hypothetical protein